MNRDLRSQTDVEQNCRERLPCFTGMLVAVAAFFYSLVRRMTQTTRKLQFALQMEDDWPPISSEAVWCDSQGSTFRLKNAPFFIKGLAVNDVFKAEPDPVNGHVFEFELLESSNHSLVWIVNNTQADIGPVLSQLRDLGCSTEGLEQFSLYAVDVPPDVQDKNLNDLLDKAEAAGLDLAFPVWRRM